jgi:hypothetical protein
MSNFQFSLKQLFVVTTLAAACMGVGRWCYVRHNDRVLPVANESHLFLNIGKRVSLHGIYENLGTNSAFQIVWLGKKRVPIALVDNFANGSRLSQIPNGATIAVTGRLACPPTEKSFHVPNGRASFYSISFLYPESYEGEIISSYCINIEDVSVVPEEPAWYGETQEP